MNKNHLSPFDKDLLVMIEQITKNETFVSLQDLQIQISVSTYNLESKIITALENAVKGKIGKRLKSISDTNNLLTIKLFYDPEDYPEQYRFEIKEPNKKSGKKFSRRIKEILAVNFTVENIETVVSFTGGGSLTTPSKMNEDENQINDLAIYEFPDENGLFLTLTEGDYVLRDENGNFSKMSKKDFENEFEPK